MENLNLPSLTLLLITLNELKNAIFSMKKGKSPEWDGIPPEFYATFWEELGQYMLDMYCG